MAGSNCCGRGKLQQQISLILTLEPTNIKAVQSNLNAYRHHQRMTERHTCTKIAFCSDVFLNSLFPRMRTVGFCVNFSLWPMLNC